jgi:GT2 family glycosyltransferase
MKTSSIEANICAVVPVFNRCNITLSFIRNLEAVRQQFVNLRLVVVDDGSTDGTSEAIEKLSLNWVHIVATPGDSWWTHSIKVGVDVALAEFAPEYYWIVNDDVTFESSTLEELVKTVENFEGQALASSVKIDCQSGKVLAAGWKRTGVLLEPRPICAGWSLQRLRQQSDAIGGYIRADCLTGASLLVTRELYREIGPFDYQRFPHHWGDFEFTSRASLRGIPCICSLSSLIFTEPNINYAIPFMDRAGRWQYLRSAFERRRYSHSFHQIRRAAFMNKPLLSGIMCYLYRSAALVKDLLVKIVMPRRYIGTLTARRVERSQDI